MIGTNVHTSARSIYKQPSQRSDDTETVSVSSLVAPVADWAPDTQIRDNTITVTAQAHKRLMIITLYSESLITLCTISGVTSGNVFLLTNVTT